MAEKKKKEGRKQEYAFWTKHKKGIKNFAWLAYVNEKIQHYLTEDISNEIAYISPK